MKILGDTLYIHAGLEYSVLLELQEKEQNEDLSFIEVSEKLNRLIRDEKVFGDINELDHATFNLLI